MMMLIHRICMALSGLGKFINVAREMSVSAAMLLATSRGRERERESGNGQTPLKHFITLCFYSRAELEADKVLDVVVNSFPLLDGRPGNRKQEAERLTL